jgi:hypothetical protein
MMRVLHTLQRLTEIRPVSSEIYEQKCNLYKPLDACRNSQTTRPQGRR